MPVQNNNPVEKRSVISVPLSQKNRLTLLFQITPSHWEKGLRFILHLEFGMPQRSSHTLDKVVNPSRLLNLLSVWTVWIYEVVRFVDFWTQKNYSHWRLVCVCVYTSESSTSAFMFLNNPIEWMHTDCKSKCKRTAPISTQKQPWNMPLRS